MEEFIDRSSYLAYAADSYSVYLKYTRENPLSVLFNEPLWLYINIAIYNFFDMYNVVRIIIFISSFIISYVLLTKFKRHTLWIIFILLFPQIMKNYIIHLRQGVAISIFVAGYYLEPSMRRWITVTLAPFIHSSFFFIVTILYFNSLMAVAKVNIYIRVAIFFVFYLALLSVLQLAASELGARQAGDLEKFVDGASGVAFIFWVCMISVFFFEGSKFIKENIFPVSLSVFYLVSYFITFYSGRIFESGLVVVMIAITELSGWRKSVAMALMIMFAAYSYISRIGQPWLGWGL